MRSQFRQLFAFTFVCCSMACGCLNAQESGPAIPEGQDALPQPSSVREQDLVTPPSKEKLRIYLLMGQSNMAGRDRKALQNQKTDLRVLAMTPDGNWIEAKDPIHQKDGRTEPGAGPGIPFALEMIKNNPSISIGLVPCAVGGSPLKRWVRGGDLYERALVKAKLASASGVICGVLWHQGETDTTKQPWAESYQKRLAKMLRDLRQDLGLPNLPIVVGQVGEFLALTPDKYPFAETVRVAIKQVAADGPNVGYADSSGLGDQGDKLHFSAEAQQQMGVRFADAMQKLQPVQPQEIK